jgi:hypothetical protein
VGVFATLDYQIAKSMLRKYPTGQGYLWERGYAKRERSRSGKIIPEKTGGAILKGGQKFLF